MTQSKRKAAGADAAVLVPHRNLPTVALAVEEGHQWIRAEAQARGWRLLNLNLYYSGDRFPGGVVPRGALVNYLPDNPRVQKLREIGCAVVRLGNLPHPDDGEMPAVLPDHRAEGQLAAEHFYERGFRHVGYFGRDPWSNAQVIFEGFRDRAQALGMACHLYQSRSKRGESDASRAERKRREFTTWLHGVPKPIGLLDPGEWLAAVNCMWVLDAGLRLPDDVAILSARSQRDICETNMPTISSLDLDDAGRVHAACELLDQMMAGAPAPAAPIMIVPKAVVDRESTDVLATPDREVAAAMRYMWAHLDLDMSVDDVARQAGMSSRQLGRRFRNALGRNVSEELLRKRLEEAKRLLRTTDHAIADVAPLVGFRSTSYLHRCFQKAFGVTPAQYRRARG